ncbi:MAG: glycoside hydrolase family 9 protein, partial [Limisphaerales bacterium]
MLKHVSTLLLLVFSILCAQAKTNDVHLRVNQVGYTPQDAKIAVLLARTPVQGKFQVVSEDGKAAFEGNIKELPNQGWGEYPFHAQLDFSSLTKPGKYHLQTATAKSHPFEIGARVYSPLPDQLLEFMHQQRCGYNPFVDAVCHPFDGRTAYGPLPSGSYMDCSGGWHDAGDQLQYLITSSTATAQLLLAYELANKNQRAQFADRVNALGQPFPNGIPDILDEAKWGLDWMLKLHPAPDHLYHQIADDRDHAGWRLPQDEKIDYGWGPGKYRVVYFADGKPQGLQKYQSESTGVANLAGRYAAAMALAYQVWKDDPRMAGYARTCLQAGKEVYEMGVAKEGVQQGNSYKAPYRYEEGTWADD